MIISVTHEVDLDGIGSQAIVKRWALREKNYSDDQIILDYSHYTNFIEVMKKNLNIVKQGKVEFLVITDIGFNDNFEFLFPLFKKSFAKIIWLDHHIVEDNIQKVLTEILSTYINDPKKCTAEICRDFFLPDDDVAKKIANYARDTDFGTKRYEEAQNLKLLISYLRGQQDFERIRKIVDFIIQGIFSNNWISERINELHTWYKRETSNALQNKQIIDIKEFGEILISFSKMVGGRIVDTLEANFPGKQGYIGIDQRFHEIIIKSADINCRELAKAFKGGGHMNRAGFKYENIFMKHFKLDNFFLKQLKEYILQFKINKK
ncbi:MAG: hypothetical protein P8Y97_10595 [Candidatus Lokiarchaeota archaeon]